MKRTESSKLFLQQAYEQHPYLIAAVAGTGIVAVAL